MVDFESTGQRIRGHVDGVFENRPRVKRGYTIFREVSKVKINEQSYSVTLYKDV